MKEFNSINSSKLKEILKNNRNKMVYIWHEGFPDHLRVSREDLKNSLNQNMEKNQFEVKIRKSAIFIYAKQHWSGKP